MTPAENAVLTMLRMAYGVMPEDTTLAGSIVRAVDRARSAQIDNRVHVENCICSDKWTMEACADYTRGYRAAKARQESTE